MVTLLADVNIQGHVDVLIRRMQAGPWAGFCDDLGISYVTFADIGLAPSASDAEVWRCCQERQIYLLTNNRNDEGPDSLESTIRACNTPRSLPVFTIGDAERLRSERDYSDRVIWALLDFLYAGDGILGTGRLYLPGTD